MKIVFVSNYLNHHQFMLCNEIKKRCDVFTFISCDEREQGYQVKIESDFVVNLKTNEEHCIKIIIDADVCIFGACPDYLINKRLQTNKLSFLYTERFLKKGMYRRFLPNTYRKIYNRILKYKNSNFYVLCAGAYVSQELIKMGFPAEKCLKWGYFPELKKYNNIQSIINKKESRTILWCGRFLDWKHPELVVSLAKKMVKNGIDFKIKMIGDGPMKNIIQSDVNKKKLSTRFEFCESLTPQKVREKMEIASIFVMTSDAYEGWGAVLNEAMNSGCLVVASHKIGSAPYLIKNKINGFIFKSNSVNDLFSVVKNLLINESNMDDIRKNAYLNIVENWNYISATENLFEIINTFYLNNSFVPAKKEGPCSSAEKITFVDTLRKKYENRFNLWNKKI